MGDIVSRRIAVLLGYDGSLTPAQVVAAAGESLQVAFLVDSSPAADGLALVAQELTATRRVDFTDSQACLAALSDMRADAVTSFVDPLASLAARLSGALKRPEAYGQADPGSVVWGRKDIQRHLLRDAGVSTVRSARLTSEAALREFAAAGLPIVIKPVDGVSSRDTWLIMDEQQLDLYISSYRPTASCQDAGRFDGMLAEGFIPGGRPHAPHLADYVSAEIFRAAGSCTAALVTDRLPLAWPCRETGLVCPTLLPPEMAATVVGYAWRALRALAAPDGAYHVEIKPRAGRPEIIEVNGRLGGYVARLVRYGTGEDLAGVALAAAASVPAEIELTWRRAVLVLLFQPPAAARRVVTAPARREIARLPGVLAVDSLGNAGDAVDWRSGSGGNVATVWLGADDHDALLAHLSGLLGVLTGRFTFAGDESAAVADDGWLTQLLEPLRRRRAADTCVAMELPQGGGASESRTSG